MQDQEYHSSKNDNQMKGGQEPDINLKKKENKNDLDFDKSNDNDITEHKTVKNNVKDSSILNVNKDGSHKQTSYSHNANRTIKADKTPKNKYNNRKKKNVLLQFDKMETDGSTNKGENNTVIGDGTSKVEKKSEQVEKKIKSLRKKQLRKVSVKMQKVYEKDSDTVKHRLNFSKELEDVKPNQVVNSIKSVTSNTLHRGISQEEKDNSAVESFHKTEQAGETLLRAHSNRRYHKQRNISSKLDRLEKKSYRVNANLSYRKYLDNNPEIKNRLLNKFIQKQRIKQEYKKAYKVNKNGTTAIKSGAGYIKSAGKKIATFIAEHKGIVVSIAAFALVFIFILSAMSSCSMLAVTALSDTMASSYLSDPNEIEKAELYYTELEVELNRKINSLEQEHPGLDEYRYNIGAISHDPHVLISYLTVKFGDFKFEDVKDEIDKLFKLQYGLDVKQVVETREETRTIQVGESLGEVVTSGYCNCVICTGIWSGGPTASGAMPQSNHTIAVDAKNPLVPLGTKIIMNGVEYTAEDTGNLNRYGVDFDVYYDNHAEALVHGHRNWEAYLAEGNENTVEVTKTITVEVLNVTLTAKTLRFAILSRMNEEEKEHYDYIYKAKGNLQIYASPLEINWYAYINKYYGYQMNLQTGQKELNRGVTISVQPGTEVKSGQTGTVINTGYENNYGYFVITEDNRGFQLKYGSLQTVEVSAGQKLTAGEVIGKTGTANNIQGGQLYIELVKNEEYYNPVFYVATGQSGYGEGGTGGNYDDETAQRIIDEAEKYLGMPYVWGGSSPATSFDCSGFVSYVYTNSGVSNMGRLTAQGIYDVCSPISPDEAQPGDIIFFTGTYSAGVPVSHVGIYVGDGMMIHCGNPIQYASVSSPYWQQHFYGYARPIN